MPKNMVNGIACMAAAGFIFTLGVPLFLHPEELDGPPLLAASLLIVCIVIGSLLVTQSIKFIMRAVLEEHLPKPTTTQSTSQGRN